MLKNEGLLVRDELVGPDASAGQAGLSERMSSLDAAVGVPLNSRGKLLGMVTVSEKTSGQAYTAEEKEWLSIFANLAATALENRRLAEELKRSKSHIQRADRLASLGTLTAALAHELRNPLVAIKTFTQLLPERFEDEEFRSHFLNIVSAEVDRISTLINELLEFARPSDPRMEAENINAILDSILFLVSTGTKKKHIDIVRSFSPNLPPVPIDR
jgi:signal transduction histidine kinase